jgi:hypothetical protein
MNPSRLHHGILRIKQLALLGCMAMAASLATGTQPALAQHTEDSPIAWIREIVSRIQAEDPPAAIVQLRNQEVMEGYVIRTGSESFALQKHDGTVRLIAYDEVMVSEYPDPAADPRDPNAETFTVIGIAPRKTSITVYSQSRCNRLWDTYTNGTEGPDEHFTDEAFNALSKWYDAICYRLHRPD